MEFQEGLMRLMIHESTNKKKRNKKRITDKKSSDSETGITKLWNIFNKSSSSSSNSSSSSSKPQTNSNNRKPPSEFLCPITGSLMADPVIITSGHTFERVCAETCKSLDLSLTLVDSSVADFSSVIPNLALKSTIAAWCRASSVEPPSPPDLDSAEKLVREFISSSPEKPLRRRRSGFSSSFSSTESSNLEIQNPNPNPNPNFFFQEEEEILTKLKSQQAFELEEGLVSLRQITKTKEDARIHLCTPRLLSAVRSLIASRYTGVQVNAAASVVNLSLANPNKKTIVRSGIVPALIDVLMSGSDEAQEHASAAIFSLSLDDECKTAIGVLGAIPPLMNLLRVDSERTRCNSVSALYHLSLVRTNRSKLVKAGSVPVFLNMVKSGHMAGRVLLVLCNLGSGLDGRVSMMDSGAVECIVGVLSGVGVGKGVVEGCLGVLCGLSEGGLRFRALAKAARAEEVLGEVERSGWGERVEKKARIVREVIKGRADEAEESFDWEELLRDGFDTDTFRGRGSCPSD